MLAKNKILLNLVLVNLLLSDRLRWRCHLSFLKMSCKIRKLTYDPWNLNLTHFPCSHFLQNLFPVYLIALCPLRNPIYVSICDVLPLARVFLVGGQIWYGLGGDGPADGQEQMQGAGPVFQLLPQAVSLFPFQSRQIDDAPKALSLITRNDRRENRLASQ